MVTKNPLQELVATVFPLNPGFPFELHYVV